ncbi:MAG: LamG domain-containing protein, partial [Planctomycetota bacterium]
MARWTFDEGEGQEALSSSGDCKGAIEGANWTEGRFGGALDFDGQNDYVSVGHLGNYEAITISMWINIDSLRSEDETNLFNNTGWEEGDLHLHITDNGQLFYSQMLEGMAELEEFSNYEFTKEDFGKWHHLAVVYDSVKKSLSYYIDGKLDSKFTLENTGPVELGPLRIACHDITNNNFDGQIDDVQIYGYP